MALEEIIDLYRLKTNFLEYLRIQRCLKVFISKLSRKNFNQSRPIIPSYLTVLLKGNGSKYFYESLNVQYDNIALRSKWSNDLNLEFINFDWDNVYKICFKIIKGHDLLWFQFRILQRILGTKEYLKKIGKNGDAVCSLCKASSETLTHFLINLFVSCPTVFDF